MKHKHLTSSNGERCSVKIKNFLFCECGNEKQQTLYPGTCVWEGMTPLSFSFHVSFNTFIIMTTKTDIATIKLVEITDALKERNRDKTDGRTLTTGYRLVVSFSSDELSDKEKELLDKLPENARERAKKVMLANRTEIRYSGVFNAEDILTKQDGTPFVTPENGLTDEQQDALCTKIKEAYSAMNNQNIFTVFTFTIAELLGESDEYKDIDYLVYENADGQKSKITEQSRLFFGFFGDIDTAKSMIRRSLLNRIENGDLDVPEKQTAKQTAKQSENGLSSLL